jgi:hypothetical protein
MFLLSRSICIDLYNGDHGWILFYLQRYDNSILHEHDDKNSFHNTVLLQKNAL